MGFRYVAQAGLDFTIFLHQSPECLDCMYESPYPVVCGEGLYVLLCACGCSGVNVGVSCTLYHFFNGLTLTLEFRFN